MGKMKTRKSAAKRYQITATGKVKFKKPGLRHNLGKHSRKRKRKLGQPGYLFEGNVGTVEVLLPYGA